MELDTEWIRDNITAKRKGKDSVFTDLFHIPKYAVQLAQVIEKDPSIKEADIEIISLRAVLLNGLYNDLGMLIKNKLLLCSEAQSTWSVNILVRMMFYAANIYQQYINKHEDWNIYGTKKLEMPQPIFTMIYTGDRKQVPKVMSLSQEFFKGNKALDLRIKVITGNGGKNIIQQYITFCWIFDEQIKKYGRTLIAIKNTLEICRNRNILREYLQERKNEVMTIMDLLFDEEELLKRYFNEKHAEIIAESRAEGRAEGEKLGEKKGRAEGEKRGILFAIRSLMNSASVTAETAMTMLNIPKSERASYIAAL